MKRATLLVLAATACAGSVDHDEPIKCHVPPVCFFSCPECESEADCVEAAPNHADENPNCAEDKTDG